MIPISLLQSRNASTLLLSAQSVNYLLRWSNCLTLVKAVPSDNKVGRAAAPKHLKFLLECSVCVARLKAKIHIKTKPMNASAVRGMTRVNAEFSRRTKAGERRSQPFSIPLWLVEEFRRVVRKCAVEVSSSNCSVMSTKPRLSLANGTSLRHVYQYRRASTNQRDDYENGAASVHFAQHF